MVELIKKRNYKRCLNCVMDTSDEGIKFDEKGVCDHCNSFYKNTLPYWEKCLNDSSGLQKRIEEIKKSGKGKDFDCIIGMSGGLDSSYLVYLAKKVFGLSPLVFHVDAGWNSDIAVSNIEAIVNSLNVELFTEVINWEEMRDIQLAYFKSGVPHIDSPQDHAFFATMYKFASKYNIKNILTGSNISTECVRNPIDWMYFQSDSLQLKDIHKKYGSKKFLNEFPTTSILWHKFWLPYIRGIKVFAPLDFVPYSKKEAKKFLEQNFNWKPYKQKHFESRFTKFYESFWLPKRFGFDVRLVQFSSLILTKQMTRESAIEELSKPPYNDNLISKEIEFVANKLEISQKELMQFLDIPRKSYKDFKNQSLIYKLGSKIFRLFKLGLAAKR